MIDYLCRNFLGFKNIFVLLFLRSHRLAMVDVHLDNVSIVVISLAVRRFKRRVPLRVGVGVRVTGEVGVDVAKKCRFRYIKDTISFRLTSKI